MKFYTKEGKERRDWQEKEILKGEGYFNLESCLLLLPTPK